MRTTLNIDDDLVAAAKELARRQGTTAGRVVSELLRRALTASETTGNAVAEPAAFYGFRPFAPGGRVVTDDDVEKLRDIEGL